MHTRQTTRQKCLWLQFPMGRSLLSRFFMQSRSNGKTSTSAGLWPSRLCGLALPRPFWRFRLAMTQQQETASGLLVKFQWKPCLIFGSSHGAATSPGFGTRYVRVCVCCLCLHPSPSHTHTHTLSLSVSLSHTHSLWPSVSVLPTRLRNSHAMLHPAPV